MKTELSRDLEKTSMRSELLANDLEWLRRLAAATDRMSVGKADLVNGRVPSAQLPSYVDDVVEAANYAALPPTGESGKIYVALDTGKVYRWGGSAYVEIAANLIDEIRVNGEPVSVEGGVVDISVPELDGRSVTQWAVTRNGTERTSRGTSRRTAMATMPTGPCTKMETGISAASARCSA